MLLNWVVLMSLVSYFLFVSLTAVVYVQGQTINTDCKVFKVIRINQVCCDAVTCVLLLSLLLCFLLLSMTAAVHVQEQTISPLAAARVGASNEGNPGCTYLQPGAFRHRISNNKMHTGIGPQNIKKNKG